MAIYNRALKRFEFIYGLYEYEARNGYRYISVGKLSKGQTCIESLNSLHVSINSLMQLRDQFGIENRFCNFGMPELPQTISKEVEMLPEMDLHNEKIENALQNLVSNRESFAIIDKGRTKDEKSRVSIENGQFYGMGYLSSDFAVNELLELKEHVVCYLCNQYIMQLINNFAVKYPRTICLRSKTVEKSKSL